MKRSKLNEEKMLKVPSEADRSPVGKALAALHSLDEAAIRLARVFCERCPSTASIASELRVQDTRTRSRREPRVDSLRR
jgi:hypothetical protein